MYHTFQPRIQNAENTTPRHILSEANHLNNAVDKLSDGMFKLTDRPKVSNKSYSPQLKTYVTGPKRG